MNVRYNPAIGILALVLGGVCLTLGLWWAMMDGVSIWQAVGVVPVVLGILCLVQPYFHVTPRSVIVNTPIGSPGEDYPYQSLLVERGKLVAVRSDGSRTTIPVSAWLAHSDDWRAVTGRR